MTAGSGLEAIVIMSNWSQYLQRMMDLNVCFKVLVAAIAILVALHF